MRPVFFTFFLLLAAMATAQKITLAVPSGHAEDIEQIAATSDGKYIASVSYKTVMIWEVASRKKIHEINLDISLDASEASSLHLTDNAGKLVVCVKGGLFCYNIQTGKEIFKDAAVTSGAIFNKNGDKIYGLDYGTLYIFDAANGNKIKLIRDVVANTVDKCKLYELDDNRLLIVHYTGWSIVNMATGEIIIKNTFTDTYSEKLSGYDYSRKNNLVVGIRGDKILFFNPLTGTIEKTKQLTDEPYGLCVSGDGNIIIFREDYKAKLFKTEVINPDNLSIIKTSSLPPSEVPEAIFYGQYCLPLPGTNKIIYNNDKQVYAYNLQDGSFSNLFQNKITDFKDFYYYKNLSQRLLADNSLVFSTEDNGIRSFNMETLKPDTYVPASAHVIYSPDGKLAAGIDKKITITNRLTGKLIKTVSLPAGVDETTEKFFFSYDNLKIVYTEWEKGNISAIDINTGVAGKLFSFGSSYYEVSSSFDGKYFACTTGSDVLYLKTVNLQTKQIVLNKRSCSPNKEATCFSSIEFLNDSYYLFTVKQGSGFIIYKADDTAYHSSFQLGADNDVLSALGGDIKNNIIALGSSDLSSYNLKLITKEGKLIREFTSQNNSKFIKAAFSKDDKVMFAATTQKGVQAWNTETGELLGTYYFIEKTNEYIFVSPEGLFDGSVEGMKELYFVKNNKPIPLEKLYEQFYTPDLLRRKVNGEKFLPPDLADLHNPPNVSIAYAAVQRNLTVADDMPTYQNNTGSAEITVAASAEDDAIDEIRLFHNGKIVTLVTRNLIVEDDKSKTAIKKYTLTLLPGQNIIRAVALNTQRTESDPADIAVVYNSGTNGSNEPKPVSNNGNAAPVALVDKSATLHLIVVGINEYRNKSMSLNYALADATSFKEEVERDAGTITGNIKTYFVTDSNADKKGIEDAFAAVKQNAKPEDVLVFYYAGHGVIGKNNEFYLVPADVSDLKNVQAELDAKGIASKLLQQFAVDIAAQKQLFILDACQSAGAFSSMLTNDGNQQKNIALVARSTGTHWMAASGAQQFANEFSSLGHGAYTYVLLQALKGEAASKNMITVEGLKAYMQTGVPALMKKYNGSQQTPASYGFGNDFPVEVLK